MALFIILGVVVLITFLVLGVLFYVLGKEAKKEEEKAVPITGMDQIKKELSSQLFEQSTHRVIEKDSEIIPIFTPKVSLPTQEIVKPSVEDEAYKKRAQYLEDELLAISKKADGQSGEARQLMESLVKENESLKAQQANLEQAQQKLVELESETSGLKIENFSLQTQLESTNGKVRLLEEEMTSVKLQMGEEIARANATVSELKREKEEAVLVAPKPVVDESLQQEFESLKAEYRQLKEKCDELEKSNQQMQYELIKAKAQVSGLDRVNFNYKNQLEDLLKRS